IPARVTARATWRSPSSFGSRPPRSSPIVAVELALDAGFDRRLVLGSEAGVDVTHDARSVDEERRGHLLQLEALGHALVGIEGDGETQPEALDEGARLACVSSRVEVHTQDDEAALTVTLMEGLEPRELFTTRLAPGRPEVEQHDLAAVILEADALARRSIEGERGCRAPWLECERADRREHHEREERRGVAGHSSSSSFT